MVTLSRWYATLLGIYTSSSIRLLITVQPWWGAQLGIVLVPLQRKDISDKSLVSYYFSLIIIIIICNLSYNTYIQELHQSTSKGESCTITLAQRRTRLTNLALCTVTQAPTSPTLAGGSVPMERRFHQGGMTCSRSIFTTQPSVVTPLSPLKKVWQLWYICAFYLDRFCYNIIRNIRHTYTHTHKENIKLYNIIIGRAVSGNKQGDCIHQIHMKTICQRMYTNGHVSRLNYYTSQSV